MNDLLGPEWHISASGYSIITENGVIKDRSRVLSSALNSDIKEICSPVLSDELAKERTSKLVLQIQKIRNISAPKANEESQAAPRLLKLSLTDGDTYVQALEISPITKISRNHTPPGSKVLINNAEVSAGYLLLTSSSCTLLGGRVPSLLEKWELAKSIQRRNYNEDGPPPWVSFGNKIQTATQESNFKSLGNKSKDSNKENSEFELQRQGAIAEATSGAVRKVFGGKVKQNIQPPNNQMRHGEKKDMHKGRIKTGSREKEFEEKPLKPSGKVSLFSFLEDKLPATETQSTAKSESNPSESKSFVKPKSSVNSDPSVNKSEPVPRSNNYQKESSHYNQQTQSIKHNVGRPQSRDNHKNYNNAVSMPNNFGGPQSKDNYKYYNNAVPTLNNFGGPQFRDSHKNYNNAVSSPNSFGGQQFRDSHKNYNNAISTPNNFGGPQYRDNHKNYNNAAAPPNNFGGSQFRDNPKNYNNAVSTNTFGGPQSRENLKNNSLPGSAPNTHYATPQQNGTSRYGSEKPKFNNYQRQDKQHSSQKNFNRPFEKPHESVPKQTHTAHGTLDFNGSHIDDGAHFPETMGTENNTTMISQNDVHKHNKEVNEVTHKMDKMSLNSQFASRSLRQHLNLNSSTKRHEDQSDKHDLGQNMNWNVGDECLAKYWEDGKFYNTDIVAVTDKTVVVKFKGYGNIEEVLRSDCTPTDKSRQNYNQSNRNYDPNGKPYSGSMEFRRRNFN